MCQNSLTKERLWFQQQKTQGNIIWFWVTKKSRSLAWLDGTEASLSLAQNICKIYTKYTQNLFVFNFILFYGDILPQRKWNKPTNDIRTNVGTNGVNNKI